MNKGKQARIAMKVMTVLIAGLTLNAVAAKDEDVPCKAGEEIKNIKAYCIDFNWHHRRL